MDNALLNTDAVCYGSQIDPSLFGPSHANSKLVHPAVGMNAQQLTQDLQRVAAIAELLQHTCAAESVGAACESIAEMLRQFTLADFVAIGIIQKQSRCSLGGFASSDKEVLNSDLRRLVEGALQEAAFREETLHWPPPDASKRFGMAVQKQLSESLQVQRSLSLPLHDEQGNLRAVVILLGNFSTESSTFVTAAGKGLAEALHLLQRTQRSPFIAWLYRVTDSFQSSKRVVYLTTAAVFALLLCIPAPFKVHSDCRLEPVVKRYVSAPFDAVLDATSVRPGDVVKSGQELARLDGGDLLLELDEAKAELHQAKKERAGHLAAHDSGKAKLSELSVRRLEAKIQLLEQRSAQLILRSPLDGIVVSGDLRSETGTPLKTGDNLFEIAPLEEMMVEILVPESQITYVRSGMPVKLEFDALPFQTFSATIAHIHPRAELVDHENIFVAELKLVNDMEALRPGMHGHAKISSDAYPWIWNWIRRPTAAIANLLGY